jgi:hypothetical protein
MSYAFLSCAFINMYTADDLCVPIMTSESNQCLLQYDDKIQRTEHNYKEYCVRYFFENSDEMMIKTCSVPNSVSLEPHKIKCCCLRSIYNSFQELWDRLETTLYIGNRDFVVNFLDVHGALITYKIPRHLVTHIFNFVKMKMGKTKIDYLGSDSYRISHLVISGEIDGYIRTLIENDKLSYEFQSLLHNLKIKHLKKKRKNIFIKPSAIPLVCDTVLSINKGENVQLFDDNDVDDDGEEWYLIDVFSLCHTHHAITSIQTKKRDVLKFLPFLVHSDESHYIMKTWSTVEHAIYDNIETYSVKDLLYLVSISNVTCNLNYCFTNTMSLKCDIDKAISRLSLNESELSSMLDINFQPF